LNISFLNEIEKKEREINDESENSRDLSNLDHLPSLASSASFQKTIEQSRENI